ncbi:MAG TPA: hypothetical protein VF467_10785 [Afipia sp.]
MRKARHIEISSRLEITKQYGLVEDYRIDWPQGSSLRSPRITVRRRPAYPVQLTRNYVTTLLEPFVPSREIVVT